MNSKGIRVNVTPAWVRLIHYTRLTIPHGEITVQIVDGEPKELISSRRRIRFDRPELMPDGIPDDGYVESAP